MRFPCLIAIATAFSLVFISSSVIGQALPGHNCDGLLGATTSPAVPVNQLVRHDGTLNLESYRGNISMAGWHMETGAHRAPRFVADHDSNTPYLRPLQTQSVPADTSWDGGFCAPGTGGRVYAVLADGAGNLYVGGGLTSADSVRTRGVAKWDGTNWTALGSGMNGDVTALAMDNSGNLYAGGAFNRAGGVSAYYVAKWDGSSWSALGLGVSDVVLALALDGGGNLYAAGYFGLSMWDGTDWRGLAMANLIHALAMDASGILYAGGEFTIGGVSANIAKWDGTSWSALGEGMNDVVCALTLDGSGNLYAGGGFTTAGGVSANYIAKWDGSTWSPVGSGMNDWVTALALDGAGNLYAGGWFTIAGSVPASRIAKWNGTTWSSVGAGANQEILALAWKAGKLYAGGAFTTAGDLDVNYVAEWNGMNWQPLGCQGSGRNNDVLALVGAGSGRLYAGGKFTMPGDGGANRVATWDGTSWSPLGLGLGGNCEPYCQVYALTLDSSGNLYAGGRFSTAGGVGAKNIARWDGTGWSPLGLGIAADIYALAADDAGNVYAGGQFSVSTHYVAKWDGTSWSELGAGTNGPVYALAVDAAGNLYAGGRFTMAGGASANHVAKWDGSNWSALGAGVDTTVYALAVDGGGNVHAGGVFTTAGGVSANHIARWDGTTWSAPGTGLNGDVYALSPAAGDLYAGGHFTTAGGSAASYIAKWDGANWSPLGSGTNYDVRAIAPSGSADLDLNVGGMFTTAGGKTSCRFGIWHIQGSPAACDLTPTALDFGSVPVGGTAEKSFAIRNTGGDLLSGSVSESCDSYSLVSGGGAFSLGPGDSAVVVVRFSPTATGSFPCAIHTGVTLCGDVSCTGIGSGVPFWIEPFNYPNGNLTVQSGLAWTTHSGTGTDIQVVDGVAAGNMANAPDDNQVFPARQAGDQTYASFKAMISRDGILPLGTNYFAHFRVGTSFTSKVWVTPSGTSFTFGLTVGGNSLALPVGDIWPVPLDYDQWYTVVIMYDAAAGVSRLWVNPAGESSHGVTATDNAWAGRLIDSFALRQSSLMTGALWRFKVDDIVVGETFEAVVHPASGVPDLMVQACEPDTVVSGQPVTLTLTVGNQGSQAAPATKTRVTVDGEVKCDQIDTPSLTVGSTASVQCALGGLSGGSHEVQVTADVTGLVAEANEGNNTLTITLFVQDVSGVDGNGFRPKTALLGTTPNPSRGTTTIRYSLAEGSSGRLDIFDAAGRLVRSLGDAPLAAGEQSVTWDGRSASGNRVSAGIYYVRFRAEERAWSRTIVIVR